MDVLKLWNDGELRLFHNVEQSEVSWVFFGLNDVSRRKKGICDIPDIEHGTWFSSSKQRSITG